MTRAGQAPARRDAHRAGQVLVVMLVAITLLAGLVVFVYNVGDQVNRRLTIQNAADAAAVSGAAWVARSMNIVAMNNVEQARLLALVPVLDSLPPAVEMTAIDLAAWQQSISQAKPQVNNTSLSAKERQILAEQFGLLSDRLNRQSQVIAASDAALNHGQFHMADVTVWPDGRLWKTARSLQEISDTTLTVASALAQASAVRTARAAGSQQAMLLPEAQIPVRPGQFSDFKPVLLGRLLQTEPDKKIEYQEVVQWPQPWYSVSQPVAPDSRAQIELVGGAITDWTPMHRLGPWAKLYRWTHEIWTDEYTPGDSWASGSGSVTLWGGPSVPGSSRRLKLQGVHTYGPFTWALQQMTENRELFDTYFSEHLADLAMIKMGFMFAEPGPGQTILWPQWETDYDKAAALARQSPQSIRRSVWAEVRIDSQLARTDVTYLKKGTYTVQMRSPLHVAGWVDLPAPRLGRTATFEDAYTWSLWKAAPNPADPAVETKMTRVSWYVFVGAEVGTDVQVDNPCDWGDKLPEDLPRPILIDVAAGDYSNNPDAGARRAMTFLAAAAEGDAVKVWPTRFKAPNPRGLTVALAQARVFNSSSWDLWTQGWDAQLSNITNVTPEGQAGTWKAVLAAHAGDAPVVVDGQAVEVGRISQYLLDLPDEFYQYFLLH